MNKSTLEQTLKQSGYSLEDSPNSSIKIGDYVQVLESPKEDFPKTLLKGLTGTVVAFTKKTDGPPDPSPALLVLLPIDNLQLYNKDELSVLPFDRPLLYVGLDQRFWGLIIQSLRVWAQSIFIQTSELPGSLTDLGDRLVDLGREIEWQIRKRNLHNERSTQTQTPTRTPTGRAVGKILGAGSRLWRRT